MPRKKNQSQYCSICYDSLTCLISPCKCYICPSCWSEIIIIQTEKSQFLYETIFCPGSRCQKALQTISLYNSMSKTLRAKIDKVALKAYFTKTPDIRRCPSAKCHYAGVIDTSSSCSEDLKCNSCGMRWRERIHLTKIEKFKESVNHALQHKNEAFSGLWKRFRTKKCPSCKVLITKNGGCDHMICSQCGWDFCWICLKKTPKHNNSIHDWEFKTKPKIYCILNLVIFCLVLFSLYLWPSINYLCHQIIVPFICWGWPTIKPFVFWIAYQIFVLVLINLNWYYVDEIYHKSLGQHSYSTFSRKELFGLIIVSAIVTCYFKLYYQILKTGLIEVVVLFLAYLKRRFGNMILGLCIKRRSKKVQ